jgi:hypothetical protein
MKIVFHAANALEAHMVQDLLAMQGVESTIQGEHLQGGAGELPALGLVKVSVEEADAARAQQIIAEWEARQPEQTPVPENRTFGVARFAVVLLLGASLGAAAVQWKSQSRVGRHGVDFDGDGNREEMLTYHNGQLSRLELDRNSDGKVDEVTDYLADGLLDKTRTDQDFDGRFETLAVYLNNLVVTENVDLDGDDEADLVVNYLTDQPVRTVTFYDAATGRARKVQRYVMSRLVSAEWDTDRDGRLDTLISYDRYEEETGRQPIPAAP